MKCPKCKHEWKDKAKSQGGKNSRRGITPEAQAKMPEGRKKGEERKGLAAINLLERDHTTADLTRQPQD